MCSDEFFLKHTLPISTFLLKECTSVLVPAIAKIINISPFNDNNCPMVFKHSLVISFFKKRYIDKESLTGMAY